MEIKTKYNIGDEVYYFDSRKALNKGIITSIEIFIDTPVAGIIKTNVYYIFGCNCRPSEDVFKDKEDVLQEILKRV